MRRQEQKKPKFNRRNWFKYAAVEQKKFAAFDDVGFPEDDLEDELKTPLLGGEREDGDGETLPGQADEGTGHGPAREEAQHVEDLLAEASNSAPAPWVEHGPSAGVAGRAEQELEEDGEELENDDLDQAVEANLRDERCSPLPSEGRHVSALSHRPHLERSCV